ncbi:MAG: CBS domain-containing protein [Candidatus Hydrothermota bacterium]|nr:MAG: CBS domain-containing protein [Candidatus Hydrothermae bacterium]
MSGSTKNRLLKEFYELPIKELMDKRIWDLPIIEKNKDINHVFSILSGKNHVWVVDNKKNMKLVGVITEHDVLSVLSPTRIPPYVFGKPDLRSLQYGLAKTAEDVMSKNPVTSRPEEKVADVLSKMRRCQVRRIPVVDEKQKLLGEITLHHLIYKYYKATQYHPLVE